MRNSLYNFAKQIPTENVNLSEDKLLELCKDRSIPNQYNLPFFKSKITARSAQFTEIVKDRIDSDRVSDIVHTFNPDNFLLFKIKVGSKDYSFLATVIIHKDHANLGLMLCKNFWPSDHKLFETKIWSLDHPLHPNRQVYVDPVDRSTLILGIDYYGELKMSVLRMAMEISRRDKGDIGLHAGSKLYVLHQGSRGVLIFGLSGTGKTSLCCHLHDKTLEESEKTIVMQDDINFLTKDGLAYGSEKSFYVKCDQCPEHKTITKAVMSKGTVLENVGVTDGKIDWKNFEHTRNTRAIVLIDTLEGTDFFGRVDLGKVDVIIYNTRRPELPPIGKLINHWQVAGYYALGESVITSAEDPSRVGESKRQIGFDPFIISDPDVNINRIADIARENNIDAYVVNTGYVGDESNDITVDMTIRCIEQAMRGKIKWKFDKQIGYMIPESIPGIDDFDRFLPFNYYSAKEYKTRMKNLREERRKYLKGIKGIDDTISIYI